MPKPSPVIASFENAYRVAVKIADVTDEDQAIISTGDPSRPFIAGKLSEPLRRCVALITAGA
jgi:aromatic ring-opening dioxygenase catalytic subunit (LigB family)